MNFYHVIKRSINLSLLNMILMRVGNHTTIMYNKVRPTEKFAWPILSSKTFLHSHINTKIYIVLVSSTLHIYTPGEEFVDNLTHVKRFQ